MNATAAQMPSTLWFDSEVRFHPINEKSKQVLEKSEGTDKTRHTPLSRLTIDAINILLERTKAARVLRAIYDYVVLASAQAMEEDIDLAPLIELRSSWRPRW